MGLIHAQSDGVAALQSKTFALTQSGCCAATLEQKRDSQISFGDALDATPAYTSNGREIRVSGMEGDTWQKTAQFAGNRQLHLAIDVPRIPRRAVGNRQSPASLRDIELGGFVRAARRKHRKRNELRGGKLLSARIERQLAR
jgi:hypothetical protein